MIGVCWIFAKHYAGIALKFVARYPWQILAIALAIVGYLGWSNASKWELRATQEKTAHDETVNGYRVASELSKKKNRNQVAAIETVQAKIIEKKVIQYVEVKSRYRATLDDKLRVNSKTNPDNPGTSGIPVISEMPGGIVRETEAAIVSRTDLEIVAENQAKLEAVIAAWLELEKQELPAIY